MCTPYKFFTMYTMDLLLQEAGIKTEEGTKEPFTELNYILDCLKQRNLDPALEWAKRHREALLAQVRTTSSIATAQITLFWCKYI